MPQLRAVTFDLWQTLMTDTAERGKLRSEWRIQGAFQTLQEAGVSLTEERVQDAYAEGFRACQAVRAHGEDVSFAQQIALFLDSIDAGLSTRLEAGMIERICSIYSDEAFLLHPPALAEGATETLAALKREGYLLGLISNTGATPGVTLRKYLRQIGVLGHFSALTFSDEMRLVKPDRRMFHDTVRRLGVAPQETVHVGDSLLNDVAGAKRAGLWAVWLEGVDQGEHLETPDATVSTLRQLTPVVEGLTGSARRRPTSS